MTIMLTERTEALLRQQAERRGESPDALAEGLLATVLEDLNRRDQEQEPDANMPQPQPTSVTPGVTASPFSAEDFAQKNDRRIALIHQEAKIGLSVAETEELESLQAQCRAYVNAATPLPGVGPLEDLEELARRLVEATTLPPTAAESEKLTSLAGTDLDVTDATNASTGARR